MKIKIAPLLPLASFTAVFMLVLVSCGRKNGEAEFNAAQESAKHEQWTNAMQQYQNVVENYPDGAHAPEALFDIGMIQYSQLRDFPAAAQTFRAVAEKYPQSNQTPKALMTLGFMFANQSPMMNVDSARKYYRQLVVQFPSNELAAQANAELAHLGESPEQMLRRTPMMNAEPPRDSLYHAPSAHALAH